MPTRAPFTRTLRWIKRTFGCGYDGAKYFMRANEKFIAPAHPSRISGNAFGSSKLLLLLAVRSSPTEPPSNSHSLPSKRLEYTATRLLPGMTRMSWNTHGPISKPTSTNMRKTGTVALPPKPSGIMEPFMCQLFLPHVRLHPCLHLCLHLSLLLLQLPVKPSLPLRAMASKFSTAGCMDSSKTCNNKAEGHRDDATIEDRKGGVNCITFGCSGNPRHLPLADR
jgi:hypothetical protein